MRLIDADALHDALREKQKWVVRYGDKHSEGYTSDQVHFAINDAPTVDAVPRELYESMEATCHKLQQALSESWIPCSERLPDENVDVLIYLYEGVPFIAWVESGRWCTEDFDIAKEDEPVAWMPLPKPYRGDKE